jgi:predicted GIY-YIG superfamily endonuclease
MSNVIYVLKSKSSGRYYIGSTSNLKQRLTHHRSGGTYSTARMGEFDLVFQQEFETLIEARDAERRIKGWKRKDFIDKMIKHGEFKTRV